MFDCIHWDFRRPLREPEREWRKWKTWEDLDLKVWIDEPVGEGKRSTMY